MVSSKPEREMEEIVEKEKGEYSMLAEVERLLKDLLKFKDVLVKSLDGANKRIDEIEGRIGTAQVPKDISIQIEKIEETIERISKEQKHYDDSKIKENLENISKSLEEIEKKAEIFSTKEIVTKEEMSKMEEDVVGISKLQKEDNKFMEAMYKEMKDNISITSGKLKETEKDIAKTKREIEKVQAFRKALGDLVKAVIE